MRTWTTPEGIAFEGIQTGDGRLFVDGAFYWDDQPNGWPLRADLEDDGMHLGAVLVGAILTLERSADGSIMSSGTLDDDDPTGADVARRMDNGAPLGVSVDMDDMEVEFVATPEEEDGGGEVVILATSFAQAQLRFLGDAHNTVELWAPGVRGLLAAQGLVAAAGDGEPEDGVVLFSDSMDALILRVTRARIRGATIVDIPAFHRAAIALDPSEAAEPPVEPGEPDVTRSARGRRGDIPAVAQVTGDADLPLAPRDHDWDGDAASQRMAGDGDEVDQDRMRAGHFWRDPDADPATRGAWHLPFADVISDTLTAVPEGIFAVAGVLQGGRGGVDIPEDDQDTIRGRVSAYYARMREEFDDDSLVAPWESDDSDSARGGCVDCAARAARAAAARQWAAARRTDPVVGAGARIPVRPPRAWFEDPQFTDSDVVEVRDPNTGRALAGVPMDYADSGEIRGHIALWGQCHTGSPEGSCVLTPRSASGYTWFRHGHVVTAEGDRIATGNMTLGGGHADIRLSYRGALEHYDNVASIIGQVVAGEDDWGVWVHGAGMPDVWSDEVEMRRLRAASPSGDWRYIGGALELTIAHCVGGPGFVVPRAQVAASGEVVGLVAAGARELAVLHEQADADAAAGQGITPEMLVTLADQAAARAVAAYVAQQRAPEAAEARDRLRAHNRRRVAGQLRRRRNARSRS